MLPPLAKRGTAANPVNRYERLHVEYEPDGGEESTPTELYRDNSKTILAENDSPDIPFRFSLNPYRGCEHGCIYCYARPSHEYLGFSAGLDFESRLLVKHEAPSLLRKAFLSPKWEPHVVAMSGNTDCYQPVEKKLQLTRGCLEVFREFLNPVAVITKSGLVARDVDILADLAAVGAASVAVSITTLQRDVARRMEPRAAQPERRLEAIRALSEAGIPVTVMAAPIVPGLTDEEIPAILKAAAEAGARSAGWILLRLMKPVDSLFDEWLERHFPNRRARVLHRIRECRDGAISDTKFGRRMRGTGVYAEHIASLFAVSARRYGLDRRQTALNTTAFRRPPQPGEQLRWF